METAIYLWLWNGCTFAAFFLKVFQFTENFQELFLSFVFNNSCINHCYCSIFIYKVRGARTSGRFTLNSVPVHPEVCLNLFKSVERGHFLWLARSDPFLSSRAARVVGWVLVRHLTITCRFRSRNISVLRGALGWLFRLVCGLVLHRVLFVTDYFFLRIVTTLVEENCKSCI